MVDENQLTIDEIFAQLVEQKCVAEDTLERCKLLLDTLGHAFDDKVGEVRRANIEIQRLGAIVQSQESQLNLNTRQILDLARQIEELRSSASTVMVIPDSKVSQLKPRKHN